LTACRDRTLQLIEGVVIAAQTIIDERCIDEIGIDLDDSLAFEQTLRVFGKAIDGDLH